ncbi:MAG: hypothetical protein OXH22_11425 [Chloroflexi bacterium]|nr:hypothetical protein [Chloroflexota bacterium]
MLNEVILVLGVIGCIAGFSVAIWSFATAGKRQEARLRKRKESISD